MSDFRITGQADALGETSNWIDSSESTTRNHTVGTDGLLAVELRPESDHAATVAVTITDGGGQENTRTITAKSNEIIPVPTGSKVRVTYTAGKESHATVRWTPMGAS